MDPIAEDLTEISQTRASMTHKLALLEERVQDTVEEAKATVMDVMDQVKGTAEDIAIRTKRTFDPVYQTGQHPWVMLGGAIVAGFLLARLGSQTGGTPSFAGSLPSTRLGAKVSEIQRGVVNELLDQAQVEVDHVKEAVIAAGRCFMRDLAKEGLAVLAELLDGREPGINPPRSRRLSHF